MEFSCIVTNLTNKSKWDAIVIVILEPGFYTAYLCTKQTNIHSLTGRPHDKISDENISKYIGHVQEVFIY